MPERKNDNFDEAVRAWGNVVVDAADVPIEKKKEGIYEYELEDGSVIRLGLVITQVLRIDGSYDADDNPTYIVKHGIVTNTISALPERRRPKK